MRLREIQRRFKDVILAPEDLSEGSSFHGLFREGAQVRLENRMKVYRNNIIRSLTDAVAGALPMTQKLTGEKFLDQAARAYVVENLPAEGNLNLYGATFANFMENYEAARALPWLPDFIRLEWAWEEACYAPDDMALPLQALSSLPQEDLPRLVFSFRTSFSLIDSAFPLDEIVDFCRSEDQNEMKALSPRGVKMMIFRPHLQTQMRKLSEGEHVFLASLKEGSTLAEAALCAANDSSFDLTEILQKHLTLETFSSFEVKQ